MAIDLNADLGDLLKQIFSGKKTPADTSLSQTATEKNLSSSGMAPLWPILLILLVVADLFLYYLPGEDSLKRDLEKTIRIEKMIAEEAGLVLRNRVTAENLQQAVESKKRLTSLMFAYREIDTLYSGIHDLAKRHSLEIIELKKEGGEAVTGKEQSASAGSNGEGKSGENSLFYRLRLSLRMKGDYLNYINMREDLLDFGKMINIDDEKIFSDIKFPRGIVGIDMKLSAYQI